MVTCDSHNWCLWSFLDCIVHINTYTYHMCSSFSPKVVIHYAFFLKGSNWIWIVIRHFNSTYLILQKLYVAAAARHWPMDKLESEPMGWQKCARRCPSPSRRSRPCGSHHSHPRPARRSDGKPSDTSSPLSNRSRPLSTCGKNGDYFNGDSDTTAFALNVNNFWLIDFVLCSNTQTALFRATLLIQGFYNFDFTLLYFTLLYYILRVIGTKYK